MHIFSHLEFKFGAKSRLIQPLSERRDEYFAGLSAVVSLLFILLLIFRLNVQISSLFVFNYCATLGSANSVPLSITQSRNVIS